MYIYMYVYIYTHVYVLVCICIYIYILPNVCVGLSRFWAGCLGINPGVQLRFCSHVLAGSDLDYHVGPPK